MGERKGVNKYYPPDYDPKMGGLNKSQGTHALRERAKKLHLGILVIRFEMPYNIWCDGCENHIGTGVRYNAEKKKVGMYYTTPIYEFRMKCHLCDNYFEIRTDPGNLDYEITSGARRQERRWDPDDNEQIAPEDKAVGRKMAADAMYRLEHGAEEEGRAKALDPVIRDLEDFQESRWQDDFSANQLLRQRFRATERAIKAQERRDAAYHLNVPLLPPSVEDAKQAALMAITLKKPEEAILEKQKQIDCQSVFTKMKPKRLSQAAKKDIAKQSIHNIIAAGTPNFTTFKNDFDKQLGSVVKRKRSRSSLSCDSDRDDVSTSNSSSSGRSGLPCDSSTSQVSSPYSDRSFNSPEPTTSVASHPSSVDTATATTKADYYQSDDVGYKGPQSLVTGHHSGTTCFQSDDRGHQSLDTGHHSGTTCFQSDDRRHQSIPQSEPTRPGLSQLRSSSTPTPPILVKSVTKLPSVVFVKGKGMIDFVKAGTSISRDIAKEDKILVTVANAKNSDIVNDRNSLNAVVIVKCDVSNNSALDSSDSTMECNNFQKSNDTPSHDKQQLRGGSSIGLLVDYSGSESD